MISKRFSKLKCASTIAVFAPLSFILCQTAFANIYDSAREKLSVYTLDTPHWYVSGNLGVSNLHDSATPGTRNSVNENGPGWNVNGGYQFNSMLGGELGYTQYHDSRETAGAVVVARTEHYAIDLAATGRYPLVEKLSALAKLGVAYSYANKVFVASGASGSAGSVSLYGGLGLAYSITPKVDFVAQFAGARGNHLTGSSDLFSLGFTFAIT